MKWNRGPEFMDIYIIKHQDMYVVIVHALLTKIVSKPAEELMSVLLITLLILTFPDFTVSQMLPDIITSSSLQFSSLSV